MFTTSAAFRAAIRQAHTMTSRVDVYRAGALVASDVGFTDGQVTINSGNGVRRQLDVTLADRALWSDLAVPGTELRPSRGVVFAGGDIERVPLGVFLVDSQSMSAAAGGGIAVSAAPDRWSYVQRARFERPTSSVPANAVKAEVQRLVLGAYSTALSNLATSTAATGVLVYDRDREKAVTDLLATIGAEAYYDNVGQLVIRNAPKLSQTPAWTVDAGESGILLDGDRRRDRSRTYNVVVVNVAVLDGQVAPAPVTVADTDTTSPTYVGGPMGRVPYFYTSKVYLTAGQMATAGQALLNRVKGANAQLSIEAAVNPALDRGDVLMVKTADGTIERHLVVGLTVPLTVEGTQSIETQSSRPDGDVPDEE